MVEMKVRVTLTEDMLGTLPGDSEIYRSWLASKNPKPETVNEEAEAIDRVQEDYVEEEFQKGCTVFARNKEGDACVYDYLIKGFFKNACKAMREVSDSESKGLSAYKTKIDNEIFVGPRMIKINHDEPITICERPLRASTPQGERVALAASESIAAGSTMEFTITIMDETKFGKYIPEWLDYGKFNGLGQWHNSGKGRFTWEDITEK